MVDLSGTGSSADHKGMLMNDLNDLREIPSHIAGLLDGTAKPAVSRAVAESDIRSN